MIEHILADNGLSLKEAKVYLAILEGGELTIARTAKKSRLKRTTVYSLIESLKEKGIISVTVRRGVQYLSVLSPKLLIERFKKCAQLAEDMLPQLLTLAYQSPLKPRIRFYEGIGGIKEILLEFSYSSVPCMIFTDYEQMPDEMFKFIRKVIVPERRKRENYIRLLVPDNATNREVKKTDNLHFGEHRIVKFPGAAKNPIEIILFEDSKIGFLSFTKEELFGVVIDSRAVYQTLKNLFELVWGWVEK